MPQLTQLPEIFWSQLFWLAVVFGSFIANGLSSGSVLGFGVGIVSFLFIVGVGALELLICALQAYVFALLTSLYLNDAVNLH